MSDTHGNRTLMMRVAKIMQSQFETGKILHIGDDFSDAQELILHGFDVSMVPGLWCEEYQNPKVQKRVIEKVRGVSIAFAHTDKDLRHQEYAAAVVITGHTHVAKLERVGSSIFMNPGHLKSLYDRGQNPSFGLLYISESEVKAEIHEVTGGLRMHLRAPRAELA